MSHPRPFYYLENFATALAGLRERYGDLLDRTEREFIERFERLPLPAAALLVRMIGRKGDLFRTAKLVYPEIGCTQAAATALIDLRWVEAAGVFLRILVRPLCDRLRALFFGNFRQEWSEFVLADLGIFRYEQVAFDAGTRAFQTRQQIEVFYALLACRRQLDESCDPRSLLQSLPPPVTGNEWLERRRQKLQFQLGQLLERNGELTRALEVYRQCAYPGSRVRCVRLLARLDRIQESLALAYQARVEPLDEGEGQLMERMWPRLQRRAGFRKASRPRLRSWSEFSLTLASDARPMCLEEAAAHSLSEPDAPAHYVENGLLNSLFGLLCWDAIFAPVPGAFFHEFQSAPSDLHVPGFRLRRERQFARCLGELDSIAYRATIRENFERKRGIRSAFVSWHLLSGPLLEATLECVPREHLRACFERILADVRVNRCGLPDLVKLWPRERRYRLIEVKGPGDRLQDNQVRWLSFFGSRGIPATVCHVAWRGFA
jgi:hypothetical protein